MSHPVFISYARDASRAHAEALHEALGPETVFLDTEVIGVGDPFPERLVDALFGARVVVVFAEPGYFTRRYCLYEFNVACEPFLRVAERPGATDAEKEAALRGIVLALPARGVDPMLDRFPPGIQGINWPSVDNPAAVAALVRRELAANPPILRERYQAIGDDAAERAKLLAATRLPTPLRIGRIPLVPVDRLAPSIGDAFVGRADDIWRIHHVLTSRSGGGWTVAGLTASLEAGGGFGKTRLALEYLYRLGIRTFRGGLFWINAESDAELQLYDVLLALNPGAPAIAAVRETPGGVRAAVARAIRSLPEDAPPPLFIVDNVPEPQSGEPPQPLDTWCPALGQVPVLATSRRRVSLGSGGSVTALPIDTLDPESAVLLLTRAVSQDALAEDEWKQIADWVGHLPLALELLHGLLSTAAMTPRAVLEMSRTERPSQALDRGIEAIRTSVPAGSLRGITEAFSASYDLLTPKQQHAARLIAWMAPEPIPEFVIEAFGGDVFTPSVRAMLRDRSFVTAVRSSSDEYFGAMHRVLADFVRSRSMLPDEIARVSSVLTALMESAEGQGDLGSKRVRATAPLASAHFGHQQVVATDAFGFAEAMKFANHSGILLQNWGYPELAGNLFVSAMVSSATHFGEEHPNTLASANNLALTLIDRGDYAGAQELQEWVLDVRRRTLGDQHPDTLGVMDGLASTLRARGLHTEAQDLQERVVEVRQQVLGEEHPKTLRAIGNLANTLSARGDLARAQELQERVLKVMQRVLGEEHPNTLTVMGNLAQTLSARGDLAQSQELQERVLEARRRILGEEHPDTLIAMSNLANTLTARGDLARAQELQEQVLGTRRRVLGEEHPDTLASMSNLAHLASRWGNHAIAQELDQRVLERRLRILGKDHPDTLASMNDLAGTLLERGDHAAAQKLQRQVVESRRRILGEEHPDTLTAMNNLASMLRDLGDRAGAQELQERVLKSMQRVLGEEHPSTLASMSNLANTLGLRGDLAKAQELQERALEARLRIFGEEHPDTLLLMSNLATTLSERGDLAKAQELQERVLTKVQPQLGIEHPWTTLSAWNLLRIYLTQDDFESATRILNESLSWILGREISSLSDQQRKIRAALEDLIFGAERDE